MRLPPTKSADVLGGPGPRRKRRQEMRGEVGDLVVIDLAGSDQDHVPGAVLRVAPLVEVGHA